MTISPYPDFKIQVKKKKGIVKVYMQGPRLQIPTPIGLYSFAETEWNGINITRGDTGDSKIVDPDYKHFRRILTKFMKSITLNPEKEIVLKISLNYDHKILLPIIFEIVSSIKIYQIKLSLILSFEKMERNHIFIPENISLFIDLKMYSISTARVNKFALPGTLYLPKEFYDLALESFSFEFYEEDMDPSDLHDDYILNCKKSDLEKIGQTYFTNLFVDSRRR